MSETSTEEPIVEVVHTLQEKLQDSTLFTDEDADKRGWISYPERIQQGDTVVIKKHVVPVKYWPEYEEVHNF